MSNQKQPKSNQQSYNFDNFLEAFRDLGRDVVSDAKTQVRQAFTTDVAENFGFDIKGGDLKPNESLDLNKIKKNAKQEGFEQAQKNFDAQLAAMQRESETRFQREQMSIRQQIQEIQTEVKQMAKSVVGFSQEVEIATMQSVVNPGVYQKNFFMHLRMVIVSLRQKAESSKNWLAAHNQRGKKKGYWAGVQKGGTSFMLSSERYAVTSTG